MPADEKLANPFTSRFNEALVYAADLHREQARKATQIPYVAHLLAVASLVMESGGSEDQAIAALLHDAIEDQGGAPTGDKIRDRFGERVYAIVSGCTDSVVEKGQQKEAWKLRKERYVAHLREAPAVVKLVSAADKLHNARAILADYRSLGEGLWNRFSAGRTDILWYYHALIEAFREPVPTDGLRRLVDELDRVIRELRAEIAAKGTTP
jgi:GTP pyrophosphokinase